MLFQLPLDKASESAKDKDKATPLKDGNLNTFYYSDKIVLIGKEIIQLQLARKYPSRISNPPSLS